MKRAEGHPEHAPETMEPAILVRRATLADAQALERLAQRDSASPLNGDVLLAERSGEPVAAIPAGGGVPIADPFQRTAEVVAMLRLASA
ncbi:hypothetical protein BH20ACT15_BH20ACT15_09600 [soil metagenome]